MKPEKAASRTRRQRLAWLHTWVGIICGWVSFAIFLTGTLALYDTELSRWMQPEIALPPGSVVSDRAFDAVVAKLHDIKARGEPEPFVVMPSLRDPSLRLVHFDGHAWTGPVFDPRSGATIPVRRTEGGIFFFDFHYTLRLGQFFGPIIVALATFGFGILLVSGVWLHVRRIVPDALTLRLRAARPRLWLDVHVLTGTAALPFHILITYTGLALLADMALPLRQPPAPPAPTEVAAPPVPAAQDWVPVAPLGPLVHRLEEQSALKASYILFSPGRIHIYTQDNSSLLPHSNPSVFDGVTGVLLPPQNGEAPDAVMRLSEGLHVARTMTPLLRALWFAGGLIATGMVASGLVFYGARRDREAKTGKVAWVALINIGVVAGLPGACLAYLWFNRLLPHAGAARAGLEVGAFFFVWALMTVLALITGRRRSGRFAWCAVLSGVAALGLGLPILDVLSGLPVTRLWGEPVFLTVDLLAVLTGIAALYGVMRLARNRTHVSHAA